MILDRISNPADIKALKREEIDELASDIRRTLVDVCSKTGGHLAPNLGVVELTLALHNVLDLPEDKIVWDVSHQSYVHKLLTGRRDRFPTLRQGGGISGFSMRSESVYDVFGAGHASTSVSAALGMVQARDIAGLDHTVVAVIGDGALTGGLAYEAINNAGQLKSNLIVILNDNEMSIAPNVGSIASYLGVLRSKPLYNTAREKVKDVLGRMPFGGAVGRAITTGEVATMRFWSPEHKAGVIFEEMGFRYIGPIDGHDYDTLVDVLSNARRVKGPVLVHVHTVKGKGYDPAELDSRTFHGCRRVRYRERQDREEGRRAQVTLGSLRRCADRLSGKRFSHHRDHRRDAGWHAAREISQALSGAVFRRRDRRSARGLFCGRRGDVGTAADRRDLLDLLAARLRSDRARRRRAESARHLLHGPRRASSATTVRRTWACTTLHTCARFRT